MPIIERRSPMKENLVANTRDILQSLQAEELRKREIQDKIKMMEEEAKIEQKYGLGDRSRTMSPSSLKMLENIERAKVEEEIPEVKQSFWGKLGAGLSPWALEKEQQVIDRPGKIEETLAQRMVPFEKQFQQQFKGQPVGAATSADVAIPADLPESTTYEEGTRATDDETGEIYEIRNGQWVRAE